MFTSRERRAKSHQPHAFEKSTTAWTAFVAASRAPIAASALDPCYQGYFRCFNARDYYEAHDVSSNTSGSRTARAARNHAFYKGLIQVAGAFVHLRKQFEHPTHAKHGRRLRPAGRLFELARANLAKYEPRHLSLDVAAVRATCARYAVLLADSEFVRNPWTPETAPQLRPDS